MNPYGWEKYWSANQAMFWRNDLSDDEALRLSAFIMQELAEGKHVTLRTTI